MTLFFVAAISSCSSQGITLTCDFYTSGQTNYVCRLINIEVLDSETNVTFDGQHVGDRTNANVTSVLIYNSNTPFVIPQVFTTFENIRIFEVEDSHLQSINIPDTVQLRRLKLDGNNLTRLESGFLEAQSQLEYFSAFTSNIVEVDENAFIGLTELHDLSLAFNHIAEIAPQTFHPLIKLNYLDLEDNLLTSISEDLFSQSPDLHSIYLENNLINEIAPQFSSNFAEGLDFINLSGNQCVDRSFHVGTEEDLIILHNLLRRCFNNFNGRTVDERDISAAFSGSLRIYDAFGNLIGHV